jgi:hypothetical protein
MNKKTLFPILFCIIFISLIWTITNFYSDFLTSQLSTVKELQTKLQIRQSFADQKSPEELAKRINEFIPVSLDRSAITNELTQFARESNIEISSISVEEKGIRIKDTNSLEIDNASINTLNSVNIVLKITGGKREIYAFLQQLTQSKRYIEVSTINLSFVKGLGDIDGTINAITYYK